MHVVVAAASKHGATTEIAEAIGAELIRRGLTVEVTEPAAVTKIDGYDAVILGSSVYLGRWQGSAKEMVERLGPELRARPVWLFSSGPLGDPPKPTEVSPDVAALVEATSAREHRVFPGRIDRSKLNFGERAVVAALRAHVGDDRDWDEITAWAGNIADALGATPAV
jgi:menaquinone-dependent protoporphyrinogen oxidase